MPTVVGPFSKPSSDPTGRFQLHFLKTYKLFNIWSDHTPGYVVLFDSQHRIILKKAFTEGLEGEAPEWFEGEVIIPAQGNEKWSLPK